MRDGQAVAAAFSVVWDHLVVEHPVRRADAIFCFGSRHWRVPERAASLYRAGVAPRVLVTGAAAPGDTVPEAARFRADLMTAGVPAAAIIEEPTATHTGENVVLGVRALREVADARTLALVSWPLAARRCLATFRHHHPEVLVRAAPALPRPGARWSPTPRRVRFALGEVERLARYGAAGHIEPQAPPPDLPGAVDVLRDYLTADQRMMRASA